MTYFFSRLTKSLSFEESSWGLSDNAAVGGVARLGVPGLELGVEVAGVAMTGVEEAEVMIGSAARRKGLSSLFQWCLEVRAERT